MVREEDMVTKVNRRHVLTGIGSGGVAVLAGCTSSNDSTNGSGTNQSSGGKNGNSQGSNSESVLFWTNYFTSRPPGRKKWGNWYKQTYQKQYGAKVNVGPFSYTKSQQKFLISAKSGSPDYIEGIPSFLPSFKSAGLIEPITKRAKGLDYWDTFVDGAKKAVTTQGEIYGLPFVGNARALLYRKDILNKYNLDPPETFEQFYHVCDVINKNESDITAFHNCTKKGGSRGFQEWLSHVYQMSDHLYKVDSNGQASLVASADDLGVVFDKFYYRVWNGDNPPADPKERGTGWQTQDPGYINGNYAMVECGPWLRGETSGADINNNKKAKAILNKKTEVKSLVAPKEAKHPKHTMLEVKTVTINKYSKHKDLAWDGAKLFCSPKSLNELRKVVPNSGELATPTNTKVKSTLKSDNWRPFIDILKDGVPLAKISWDPVHQTVYKYLQPVVYGKMDPHKAGQQLHDELKNLESQLSA